QRSLSRMGGRVATRAHPSRGDDFLVSRPTTWNSEYAPLALFCGTSDVAGLRPMAASPAFITQYEILRSRDYVLIAFSYPTGEITDGSMRTEEAQRIALTIPRFLELAGAMSQIAHSIQA